MMALQKINPFERTAQKVIMRQNGVTKVLPTPIRRFMTDVTLFGAFQRTSACF